MTNEKMVYEQDSEWVIGQLIAKSVQVEPMHDRAKVVLGTEAVDCLTIEFRADLGRWFIQNADRLFRITITTEQP